MPTVEPPSPLVFLDADFTNFRDYDTDPARRFAGFRWIVTKRLRLPDARLDDRAVLAALIAHTHYRDTYDGPGLWDEPRHGQWWSYRITPETYRLVDATTAAAIIDEWAEPLDLHPAELRTRLREQVHAPILSATSVFELGPLPADARHDYGPVHDEFHELVLIDRAAGVLTVLVAADD